MAGDKHNKQQPDLNGDVWAEGLLPVRGLTAGPFFTPEYPGGISLEVSPYPYPIRDEALSAVSGDPFIPGIAESVQERTFWETFLGAALETTQGTPVEPGLLYDREERVWRWRTGGSAVQQPDGTYVIPAPETPDTPDPRFAWWLSATREAIITALGVPADYVAPGSERAELLDKALTEAYHVAYDHGWADEEPEDEDEADALSEGVEAVKRGETVTWEQARTELDWDKD